MDLMDLMVQFLIVVNKVVLVVLVVVVLDRLLHLIKVEENVNQEVVLVEKVEMKRPLELDMIMMELHKVVIQILVVDINVLELLVMGEVMVLQLDALLDILLLSLMMAQSVVKPLPQEFHK